MRRFTLGIDIGGTNIKLGLVSASGKVLVKHTISTNIVIRNKTSLISALITSIDNILRENKLRKADILGLGIGLPGLIDVKKGIVRSLTNIPHWKNTSLKKIIQRKVRVPTYLDNDANMVTLGEWQFGAGRGFQNLICITLGTGIGGGVVINNQLYRGDNYTAGEIGHVPLNEYGLKCKCGGFGCLERSVGNAYLLAKARNIFKNKNISLEEITRLTNKGNKRALLFWEETAVHLGNTLSGVVNLLNPQCIVIGGGIANAPRCLLDGIRATIRKRAMSIPAKTVKIVKSQLSDDAGIIGAHVLVKNLIGRN